MLTIAELNAAAEPLTSFLTKLGYSTSGFMTRTDGMVGETYNLEFEKTETEMKVHLHLAWSQTYCGLQICRKNSSFHLDRYFVVKGMQEEIATLKTLDNLKSSVNSDALAKLTTEMVKLLDLYLKDVLEGLRWEDIPIDWAGYR